MNKTIIVLANSRKLKGNCVAGIDVETREWIRPVSAVGDQGSLSKEETRVYNNHGDKYYALNLAKRVSIPLLPGQKGGSVDLPYQTENYTVDRNQVWKYNGGPISWGECLSLTNDDVLWAHNSSNVKGDRVSLAHAKTLRDSLRMIRVDELKVFASPYGRTGFRGGFIHAGREYDLRVTDPRIERLCGERSDELPLVFHNCCVVVSLGVPYRTGTRGDVYVFLLIAAILCESDSFFR